MTKHLIKVSNMIFTLNTTGQWENTNIIGNPTTSDFDLHGIDIITSTTEEQWSQLQKPIEILTWTESEEAISANINYKQKEFIVPKLELTVPEYKPIDLIEGDIEIVALGEGEEVPKLHIEGFRDLRPFCESDNPKLLINTEQENSPMINTSAIPQRQLVVSKDDIVLRMLNRVQSFTITSIENTNGKVRIIASVDGGLTWKTFDATLGEFKDVDIANLDEVEREGMTITEFNSVGLNWNGLIRESRIKFGYYLKIDEIDDVAEVDKLEVSMEVLGSWEGTLHEVDYNYEYDNEKIYIDLYRDGSYKMNYN